LPILVAIALAFHKVQVKLLTILEPENFLRMLNDERVWIALKNTAEYVTIVVPIQTVSLSLALILNAQIKERTGFDFFFLPTVTSSAVLTLIFMWICNSNGLLNNFLAFFWECLLTTG